MSEEIIAALYVVATPIGNLEDITYRAVNILKNVTFAATEDTRHSGRLFAHYEINTTLVSYHSHSSTSKEEAIIERIKNGESCALITDAGTPGISDPGVKLISMAHRAGVRVVPIPGPSAFVALLSASGIPSPNAVFVGFLPPKSGKRKNRFAEYKETNKSPIIFYESVHRIKKFLDDAKEVFDESTPVVIGRELTKKFEQICSTTVGEASGLIGAGIGEKGEFVVIIDNRDVK